jgi:hypothetical protein
MNHLIDQLKNTMIASLETAIIDSEKDMIACIARQRESNDDEQPIKFSVSMKGTLNLDKGAIETSFGYSTRTVIKDEFLIEDPNQPSLPLENPPKNDGIKVVYSGEDDQD